MITQLSIQGLAIIDSLTIEFSSGFNVITGETGAGKSILIRALNFLMGGKAGAETIRSGAEGASVWGEFHLAEEHPALAVMNELAIPLEEIPSGRKKYYSLLIRRTLTQKGRSQAWLNDVPVTSAPLRMLGSTLVDVFGQHENQRLMDSTAHLSYIDCFLDEKGAKSATCVEKLSTEAQELVSRINEKLTTFRDREKSRDYVSFRLDELKQFSASIDDYERVAELCRRANSQGHERDAIAKAVRLLDDDESSGRSLSQNLREASKVLAHLALPSADGRYKHFQDRLLILAQELDDLSYGLGKTMSEFEFDESEVEHAQERLYGYQDLFRKHAVSDVGALLGESERLKREIDFLESAASEVADLLETLSRVATELEGQAKDLSRARQQAAKRVKRLVEAELHQLAMPGAKLEVEFSPIERVIKNLELHLLGPDLENSWRAIAPILTSISDKGAERGQFLLASNPGEAILPLSRIASGGELSRIMLALKKALAADADTCVLVFDEIDTGISGRVADVVGSKMRDLSGAFQVICISHLPQVAVYADAHFRVQKEEKGKRTESSIVKLSKEESAKEIARLLSGAEVSTPSLANARSLIQRAKANRVGHP